MITRSLPIRIKKQVLPLRWAIVFLFSSAALAATPAGQWLHYDDPSQAGFDKEKLAVVDSLIRNSNAAAVMIVKDGHVVRNWGDISRRFTCASMRKSLLHSVFGIYVEKGVIDTGATLAVLGIEEIGGLTEMESQTRVADLLGSRSGVYLPSAYAPQGMKDQLPARGSHQPGTHWFYNNWDFNVLGTIFERESGLTVFDAFNNSIAGPLGMEDFTLQHTFDREEPDVSNHSAYIFRMSARDLARFGVLYANAGKWNDRQIVPEKWIELSSQPISPAWPEIAYRTSYGYLWWVAQEAFGQPGIFANGAGGQTVAVFPQSKLVIVHLVNTYDNIDVHDSEIAQLLTAVLDAQVGETDSNPVLRPLDVDPKVLQDKVTLSETALARFTGQYRHRFLGTMEVAPQGKRPVLNTGIGSFDLFTVNDSTLIPQDILIDIIFTPAIDPSNVGTAKSVMTDDRRIDHLEFYYK